MMTLNIITVPCIILLVVVVELFVSHDLYTFQDKPAEQVTNSNKSPPVAGKYPCNQDFLLIDNILCVIKIW